MKRILLLLLIVGLWGCSDDDSILNVKMNPEGLSFRPIAGGAVMHYDLPADDQVLFIRARYQDAFGQEIIRTGSYACDSMLLIGFNEAQKDVPVHITLCDQNEVESEAIEATFDTEDSGPIAFFKHVKIQPDWNGFSVSYDVPDNANGMAHVFYTGENPMTHEPDTLLLESFPITKGADTLIFRVQQESPTHNVVIRTEDFRGYMVKEQVWENVVAYNTSKLDVEQFDFFDPNNLSQENSTMRLGKQYLFDGDIKGESALSLTRQEYNTYLAGPDAFDKDLFVIDLREPKVVAELRLYAMLNLENKAFGYGTLFYDAYDCKLPCDLKVYSSNDGEEWTEIYHFEDDPDLSRELRWCADAASSSWSYISTIEELNAAEPNYLQLMFSATAEPVRYLKVEVIDTYNSTTYGSNSSDYVTIHELEVYTKKEE